jgi:hypothetical protein
MNAIDGILNSIMDITTRLKRIEVQERPTWIYLQTPLTSVSWDGDMYSSTGPTLIDLSAVFGTPAYIKAVLLQIEGYDTGQAPSNVPYFVVGPNVTYYYAVTIYPIAGGIWSSNAGISPCNANGDIYFRTSATGAGTLSCWITIWGYLV